MERKQDIRWIQRLEHYTKAVLKITEAVGILKNKKADDWQDDMDALLKEGLIQRFEYTHELAWNLMKDFEEYQGNFEIRGSRDATRAALKIKIISDGEIWMDMIVSRNQTSHSYNETVASDIFVKITDKYFPLFVTFRDTMNALRDGMETDIFDQ